MDNVLRKFVKKILLTPIIEKQFERIWQFYLNQFYKRIQSGQTEYMFKILDIRENFSDKDAKALVAVVKMILKKGMQIVEIGSWKGFSTYFLAKTALDCNGKVFAVDYWKGNKNTPSYECAKKINIFTIFKHNMTMLGVEKVVHPLKMDSLKASERFKDGTLDLVFLDGDHRYENFKKDILSWFPKIKRGGIICGHDCEEYYENYSKELKCKIDKSLEEDFIPKIGHPGIIKGLHKIFGKEYLIMPDSIVWYYVKKKNLPFKI